MFRKSALVALASAALLGWALAGTPPPKIPAPVVEKQVAKLTEKVHWHSSLEEAENQARKENKLIFWLHALGELDGTC